MAARGRGVLTGVVLRTRFLSATLEAPRSSLRGFIFLTYLGKAWPREKRQPPPQGPLN
ncbi:MAG: hypothetical protein JWM16_2580 [Verrucomicrobiales bacterium]|nr:hypothetical protein [Verrucomicrobiales bacterium]